jgi:hypothetical protein
VSARFSQRTHRSEVIIGPAQEVGPKWLQLMHEMVPNDRARFPGRRVFLFELREGELQKVSGGYIGETEKNISYGKTTF